MSPPGATPAIEGGIPVRKAPLPYARHSLTDGDKAAALQSLDTALTEGPAVAAFERKLTEICGAEYAVAVSSGTAALHVAYAALGAGNGWDVHVPPLTFVATANAALYTGATPRFVDIGVEDLCLDERLVEINDPHRSIVSTVDYTGLPADTDRLRSSLPRTVPVIADASHSLGGSLRGRPVGSLATITTLSFHPAKLITTGEGGACVTNDGELAALMRRLRSHGSTSTAQERTGSNWRYDCDLLGFNYRMPDFGAALGLSQLARLDDIVARRTAIAHQYDEMLGSIPGITLPPRPAERLSAWHLYVIRVNHDFGWSADELINALRAEQIQATRHYPTVFELSTYANYQPTAECPVARSISETLVTLPLFPAMTDQDIEDVVTAIQRLYSWRSSAHTRPRL